MTGPVMFRAVPEVPQPCWVCGRDPRGCYVAWDTVSAGIVHVCDECMADHDAALDDVPDEPGFLREGQPEFNGAFG